MLPWEIKPLAGNPLKSAWLEQLKGYETASLTLLKHVHENKHYSYDVEMTVKLDVRRIQRSFNCSRSSQS